MGAAGRRHHLRPGLVRRRQRLRPAGRHPRRAGGQPRHRRQRRVLPVDPAGDVPDRAQADAAHRHGREHARPVAAGRRREAVRRGPALQPRAERAGRLGVQRRRRLPHRPLPGQGDRPEPAGAAVRQHAVRADLERPPRRLGADHHGRGRRHRRPGGVLREDRRRPRRAAEPPAAAAGADRDGGAGRVLRRGDPHREAQGAARGLAARGPGDASPSAASTSRAGWPASGPSGYRQEDGVDPKSSTETFAAVRFGVETRRWAGVPFYLRTGKRLPRRVTEIALSSSAPRTCRSPRPTPRSWATTSSSSASSPTRA